MTNRLCYGDNLSVLREHACRGARTTLKKRDLRWKGPGRTRCFEPTAMVRDLGTPIMARAGHRLGLFVCAVLPTKGMTEEAASHGLIETDWGRFPALQTYTLAELFGDHRSKLPPLVSPNRRAPRVETRASHKAGAQDTLL